MKKTSFLKSLLVAAALCTGGSAWATDVPYTIGSEGCGYRAEYSDPYTLEAGETLHFSFVNNNFGTSTIWNNYMVEATSAVNQHDAPYLYFDLRGDNFAFEKGTFVQNYNGNFLSDLNGANIEMDVTYVGGVITVEQIFTKAEVTTYYRKYTYNVDGSPASVIIYLTEEAAQVTINSVEKSAWTSVWSTDFSSAPSGMTYSVTNGSTNITNGYLELAQGGNGDRTMNVSFTDAAFNVTTDWIMEFDWSASLSNQNNSTATFATDQGNAFVLTWANNGAYVSTLKDASDNTLTTTLPVSGYNTSVMSNKAHFVVKGVKDDGIYLTVTDAGVTYVNNVKVTSTFGYPKTFNGTLGRAVSRMFLDEIVFKTPTVAGFVAVPTGTITAPDGTNRKFTLDCVTDGATIYYATSDLEIGAAGWIEYTGEVSTDAATIYTYAKKGSNASEKGSFATGAGTAITLNAPTFTVTGMAETSGFYYPVVTISNNQSGLAIVPATTTLTYTLNGGDIVGSTPYTFTAGGNLTVTVSAEGYTSQSANFVVAQPYIKTKTIDLQAITASDLSSSWKLMAENTGLQGTWSSPYNGTTYSRYWYDVTEESSSRITLVDGLEGWYQNSDGANKSYYFYPGLGLVVPLTTQKDDGTENGGSNYGSNNHALYLAGGTNDQYVTWKYGNNYGKNADKTTVTAGNASYNLYRYSDILTKVEVYSPAVPVEGTIAASGYSTLSSAFNLDFSAATGIEAAYVVTNITKDAVTLTSVNELPANNGVILKGTGGDSYSIPVKATAEAPATNYLKAAVTATAIAANEAYILKDGQFHLVTNASTVPAGKAYLLADDVPDAARSLDFVFAGEETTGINTVAREIQNGEFYNIQGQRVAAPAKGLYIVNGKKVIVK